jgi:anti-anti-sigma factor
MAARQLRVSVRHEPGVAILDLHGDIDGRAEDVLERAYTTAEGQHPAAILLNASQVTYINSKGIALLVVLLRRATKSGRRLWICGLNEHYQEIFRITRLSDYIAVSPDETSALAEIQQHDAIVPSPAG